MDDELAGQAGVDEGGFGGCGVEEGVEGEVGAGGGEDDLEEVVFGEE